MDEFSFPKIAGDAETLCHNPFLPFKASPLWFVSSVTPPGGCHHRRSFSFAEHFDVIACESEMISKEDELKAQSERGIGRFLKDEDRMDLLWEDFNEELHRAPSSLQERRSAEGSGRRLHTERKYSAELYHVYPTTSSMFRHRRPSLLMMLRGVKKIFMIQKTGGSKRTALYQ